MRAIRRLVVGLAMVVAAAGSVSARDLSDILEDKGVITEDEAGEAKRSTAGVASPSANEFTVYWKEGLRLDTKDKAFQLKIGGRIQNDWALISSDEDLEKAFSDLDEFETGTEFRRARLYVSGTVYETVEFKAQYDFAGGDPDFKDVWLAWKKLPVLSSVKVGHFKEPFSLEELTSSKYGTFLERGLPSVLAPSRNTGLAVYAHAAGNRATLTAGGFRETDDFGNGFGEDSQYNLTARVTGLPWYEEDGSRLLHLGFSYSHKFRNDDDVRFRQRPEVHLSPVRFVDTGALTADGIDLINPEMALMVGPVSVQGEYMHGFVDTQGSDPDFYGYYVYASYFLTGEHRNYKTSAAAFDRTKPKRNFSLDGDGCGAWEVAVRYSKLDLDSESISGGELDDVTAALNWYLNPNVRLMLNYVFSDRDPTGEAHIAQGRFQIDF